MPIALTCTCGAKLEIDDKFAGQSIPCPDCSKPLLAELPLPAPTRTSGLAILSLLLALVGAFTIVGTLAAMACGTIAYRQLTRKRGPVGGVRLAQAGILLGALFTVLAVVAYTSRSLLGVDGLYRQFLWAGKLKFDGPIQVSKKRQFDDRGYTMDRPSSAWGVLDGTSLQKQNDHMLLVSLRDDAFLLWLSETKLEDDDRASFRSRLLDGFRASEFVKLIGRLPENISESIKERGVNDVQNEFLLDLKLDGIPRTLLFRFEWNEKKESRPINVLIGAARSHRFGRLEPALRLALDSFKSEAGQ